MSNRKFTLKQDGKYFSAIGCKTGFFAFGIGGCYSYDLPTVKQLQVMMGGKIVEVVSLGGFKFEEKECEL